LKNCRGSMIQRAQQTKRLKRRSSSTTTMKKSLHGTLKHRPITVTNMYPMHVPSHGSNMTMERILSPTSIKR
jgi:hypothetical protein